MGMETVVDDIKDEAREEAEALVTDAEAEAEQMLEEARKEAEEIRNAEEEKAEREAEEIHEQTVSSARLDARKMRSQAEKRLLSNLREEVEDRLSELEESREDLTRDLIEDAVDELDQDGGTVRGAEHDTELVKELVEEFDGYTVGDPVEILGGVVVEGGDGEVRVDNSFDSVLERVWNQELKEISTELLGEG